MAFQSEWGFGRSTAWSDCRSETLIETSNSLWCHEQRRKNVGRSLTWSALLSSECSIIFFGPHTETLPPQRCAHFISTLLIRIVAVGRFAQVAHQQPPNQDESILIAVIPVFGLAESTGVARCPELKEFHVGTNHSRFRNSALNTPSPDCFPSQSTEPIWDLGECEVSPLAHERIGDRQDSWVWTPGN